MSVDYFISALMCYFCFEIEKIVIYSNRMELRM